MSERPVLQPGPDHPITIEPETRRVRIRVGERTVADTTDALVLREADYPPVHYVPLIDVDKSVLQPSDHHTYCPFKGEASYYSLGAAADKVWYYPEPHHAVRSIAGHVAFYADAVTVETLSA